MKKHIRELVMYKWVSNRLRSKRASDLDIPHYERVKKWGHRAYVGGQDSETWYGIGKRQYHFLVSYGLTPNHKFLDVACGSLRLGQYLIPMLKEGHYFGLEGEKELVNLGAKYELLFNIIDIKKPKFSFNYDFNFNFCDGYDYAIAQSLFTHLTLEDITKCFERLNQIANDDSKFFFTFFEGDEANNKHRKSHANINWCYQFSTLRDLAERCGFSVMRIGEWGHERGQVMAVATKSS